MGGVACEGARWDAFEETGRPGNWQRAKRQQSKAATHPLNNSRQRLRAAEGTVLTGHLRQLVELMRPPLLMLPSGQGRHSSSLVRLDGV